MQARDVEMEEVSVTVTPPVVSGMDETHEQPEQTEHANQCCARSFSNFCDPDFFKSVINVKEIFIPLTAKKILWWTATAAAVGGLVTAEVLTGCFSTVANYENIALMVLLYGIDPAVFTLNILTAKYPPAIAPAEQTSDGHEAENSRDNDIPDNTNEAVTLLMEEDNSKIAAVIPCHLAADKIEITVRSLLQHLNPEQIFIVDNGNSEVPLDNTREIVKRIDPRINYIWGNIGNKTFAQYIGTLAAKEKGFTIIYTSDDDMIVPKYFSFGAELLDHEYKAVCYPIVAVEESQENKGELPDPAKANLLVRLQSLGYKLSDCAKLSQARFGGVLVPHGAASLWDLEVFLLCLKKHDAVFYMEDGKLGWALKELGYKMAIAGGACLSTFAPRSLFGKKPNYYEQQIRSWRMGSQWYFWGFIKQVFTRAPTTGPIEWLVYKFAEIYAVYNNIIDWIRLPYFILKMMSPTFWIRYAIIFGAANLPMLGWNYIKLPLVQRKDLQSSLLDVLLFQFFKILESAMSIGGIGRLLSVYGPNFKKKPDVKEYAVSLTKNRRKLLENIHKAKRTMNDPPMTYRRMMYQLRFGEIPIDDINDAGNSNEPHQPDLENDMRQPVVSSLGMFSVVHNSNNDEAAEPSVTTHIRESRDYPLRFDGDSHEGSCSSSNNFL